MTCVSHDPKPLFSPKSKSQTVGRALCNVEVRLRALLRVARSKAVGRACEIAR